ncbi:hypothetical protein IGI04_031693 [Brassica rapa subsp. trilocularis]|uniref:U-box domain-containing protein n=1 Tax=Brassica rapa subsp. trilocularis TaxID=1813537 RepID=A0ABQ7LUA5_BRACM|nr:hypothetical protein IGI04_031693 [Brassica rapa subsp. trilocularis]
MTVLWSVSYLFTDPTTASVSVTEKFLKLRESLASTKEGRSKICGGDGKCLKTVVKKLMKVSTSATQHAVMVLWSVSYLFKEEKALEAVTSTKILFGAEGCFNHLGVLHVQVISCSLYGDDDVDNSMLHNYYYFYNLR